MLVKAKWNVKGSDGWHFSGEVFDAKEDLGDAVEVLEPVAVPDAKAPEMEPEAAHVTEAAKNESVSDCPQVTQKTKASTRRRNTAAAK